MRFHLDDDCRFWRLTWKEWEALHAVAEENERRKDCRTAMLAVLYANVNYRKRGQRAFTIDDFLPKARKTARKAQTYQEQKARLLLMAEALRCAMNKRR